ASLLAVDKEQLLCVWPPLADAKAPNRCSEAQVVGWPPIRSYRKNTMATNLSAPRSKDEAEAKQTPVPDCLYVKVSMDGAPYLRKVDLKMYKNYKDLSLELEKKFSGFTVALETPLILPVSELVLTYEDKDGDWMLVGDVPWR
uniref:Auxin-responsive protein n=1 Tax=Aegilops tauschii subsp. strangulata TaxID=200361 RepID=A0A453S7M8_AEGTS